MTRPQSGWLGALVVVTALTVAALAALDLEIPALLDPGEADAALRRVQSFGHGFLSPDLSAKALLRCGRLAIDTLAVGVAGTAAGACLGLGLGLLASRAALAAGRVATGPTSRAVVVLARGVLDVLRAIPDFAWALVVLAFIGPGLLTGAIAIAITVTGVLGRTYGQLVDAVPYAEVRAVEALGGPRAALVAYGRLPRIGPSAWSYTLVRLECSVRNASVIGIVGGGGLGAELFEELGYGRDDRVATILLALVGLTAAVDFASTMLRRRLATRRISRRHTLIGGTVVVAAAVAWLVQDLGGWRPSDATFITEAFASLARPDLSAAMLGQAARGSAIPLATAWLATLVSAAVALSIAPWASRDLLRRNAAPSAINSMSERALIEFVRGLAVLARAVPDVAWLLLLAAVLRMGHAAALLALTLHSVGILVRVFCETVDDDGVVRPDDGPAGRVTALAYRVVPRVRATLLTHTMLQGEANLRAAVVLGIVGAGGLGDAFHTAVSFWRLEQASTLALTMVVIFIAADRIARAVTARAVGRPTSATAVVRLRGSASKG